MFAILVAIASLTAAQVVGIVFLVAGLGKLLNAEGTVHSLEAYRLFPSRLVRVAARLLPWAELAVALALMSSAALIGALGAMVLLISFSAAQITTLLRGLEVPCGCFGSFSAQTVRWRNVFTNFSAAVCCLFVFAERYQANATELLGASAPMALSTGEDVQVRLIITAVLAQLMIVSRLVQNWSYERDYRQYLHEQRATSAIQRMPAVHRLEQEQVI